MMSTLAASGDNVLDAINTAYLSAATSPSPVSPANVGTWKLWVETYADAGATGYQVVAVYTVGQQEIRLVHQSGSEVSREKMPTFGDFKAQVMAAVDEEYQVNLAKGITVANTSGTVIVTFGTTDKAQNDFERIKNTLDNADIGTSVDLTDINGNAVTVSVSDAYKLYSDYRKGIYTQQQSYKTKKAALQAAASFDQLP